MKDKSKKPKPKKFERTVPIFLLDHRVAAGPRFDRAKLTQEFIAGEIGEKHSKVQRIEKGHQQYQEEYLSSFAKLCGVTVPELFYKPGEAPAMPTEEEVLLRQLTPDERDHVRDLMLSYLRKRRA